MADTESAGDRFEARIRHFIHIANCAVDDGADASESAVDIGIDLAPEGAKGVRFIEVLDNDDLWPRLGGDVFAIFRPGIGIVLAMGLLAGLNYDGDGVADHRPHLRHEVAYFFQVKPIAR